MLMTAQEYQAVRAALVSAHIDCSQTWVEAEGKYLVCAKCRNSRTGNVSVVRVMGTGDDAVAAAIAEVTGQQVAKNNATANRKAAQRSVDAS